MAEKNVRCIIVYGYNIYYIIIFLQQIGRYFLFVEIVVERRGKAKAVQTFLTTSIKRSTRATWRKVFITFVKLFKLFLNNQGISEMFKNPFYSALKLLDGGRSGKGDARYREIVWKLDERGSMGENLVGCCLMQGSPIHNALAVRLFNEFPKLINDVFLSEDYYGVSSDFYANLFS